MSTDRNITQLKLKSDGTLHIEWTEQSPNYTGEDLYKVDFVEAPRPELNKAIRNLVDEAVQVFEINTQNAECGLVKFDYNHTFEVVRLELARKVQYIDDALTIKTGWSNDISLDTVADLQEEIDQYIGGKRAQTELFENMSKTAGELKEMGVRRIESANQAVNQ